MSAEHLIEGPLIEARGLQVYYGESHILHGVDFKVGAGETVGLLGRNGMGKTTLLRSLLGLTPPRQGHVRIRGSDMTGAKPHLVARQGIAFVPEGRGIFPNLSVKEHLLLAARPRHGEARKGRTSWDLKRVLETFPRLKHRLDLSGSLLSGGEQQMLTIGRALMTNPDLVILDEATEGLSPILAKEIWAIIRALRQSGIACVVVDKNFAAVSELADRCVVLVKGRVVLEDAAAGLKKKRATLHRHLGV
ncbi:MAG TPA: ABC transporter ATP-binding protein [Stellaceae bacterium]|nr:ABC transporter ATP-binding protein [Stellaceae bacterium]